MPVEAALRFLILGANFCLGLAFVLGWFQAPLAQALHLPSAIQLHLTTAGIAVLVALFSDTCVLFYFIGTAVWMRDRSKEIVLRNRDSALRAWECYEKANKLKAKTFPFACFGLILGLFTFILGGANQVGAVANWVHPLLATLFLVNELIGTRFYLRAMRENVAYLDTVSREIKQTLG